MAAEVIVTDWAFPYLVAQRGALDGLKGDRAAWEAAYREDLARDFADLEPALPGRCARVLDVGGGMGGIDVLLARRYADLRITLLDSLEARPEVRSHAEPFSHHAPAAEFLLANGADLPLFIDPASTRDYPGSGPAVVPPFDLVISLQAWGFHFAPETYLDFVRASCRPGTVLVLDVRRGRSDWLVTLAAAFAPHCVLRSAPKFTRMAYVAR